MNPRRLICAQWAMCIIWVVWSLSLHASAPSRISASPQGTSVRDPIIKVFIRDFDAQVVPGSVRLFLNGEELTPLTIVDTAIGVEAAYSRRLYLFPGHSQTATVLYTEDAAPSVTLSNSWSFTVGPLTHDTLIIEAEDFNFSNDGVTGGLHANAGDPDCSLLGRDALRGIDYNEINDSNSQPSYRGPTGVESESIGSTDATRAERTNTCDYVVTSNDPGDWYNYTRNFGDRIRYFMVFLRASSLTGGRVRLDSVENPGTAAQVATNIATFDIAATTGSNHFTFTALRDASSNRVLLPLCAERTFRLTVVDGSVDLNYLAFAPFGEVDEIPYVFGINPPPGSDYASAPLISFGLTDLASPVPPASVKVFFDCLDVTSQASITPSNSTVLVTFQAPQSALGTRHFIRVHWRNTRQCGSPERWHEWSYMEGPYDPARNLFIEAEDFDTAGGTYFPSNPATTNHFNHKGLYQGTAAIHDLDYHFQPQSGAPLIYRSDLHPIVGMMEITDARAGGRPGFEQTADYKIGWNMPGNWYNYTRHWDGPNWYHVYLRASHGDTNSRIRGALGLVDTNGPAENFGTFDGPATGNWEVFTFISLRDSFGNRPALRLGGERTLRYTVFDGGVSSPSAADLNYLMFVPLTPTLTPPAPFIRLRQCDAGGVVQLTFYGLLQSAEAITGPWETVTNAPSPLVVFQSSFRQKFWRVVPP